MAKKPVISLELGNAVWSTLYHDERSSPAIIQLMTGRIFKTPPPPPTEEQKEMAREIVEEFISLHYHCLADAVRETTGEEIDLPPFTKSLLETSDDD